MSLKYVALMNYGCLEQGELQNYIWLVVYIPLWKIWVRQLGWLFLIWKNQIHVPNHQPVDIRAIHQSYSGWWCNNNLEKYESMGRMTSHIWNGKKTCLKPPTSYLAICFPWWFTLPWSRSRTPQRSWGASRSPLLYFHGKSHQQMGKGKL